MEASQPRLARSRLNEARSPFNGLIWTHQAGQPGWDMTGLGNQLNRAGKDETTHAHVSHVNFKMKNKWNNST